MQDSSFYLHNRHLEDPLKFQQLDPQLRALKRLKYIYKPPIIDSLPKLIPGIYSITGSRQIGKTTLSKQWMQHLLYEGIQPEAIAYFTGEIIVDHLSLIRQLQNHITNMPSEIIKYVIVDEVTYILNWDMGVKFLADAGLLENVILIITGSDSRIIQEARMRFPGRRGKADQVNFHLHPLSFYEMLKLTNEIDCLDNRLVSDFPDIELTQKLERLLANYLIHGGYLTAINDYAENGKIDKYSLETYADWIRGDVIKYGKSDHHCREFFLAMLKTLNSQITWNALAKNFAIEHHQTVADYAALLSAMDAIYIQQALIEDKLVGSVKKARKLIFTDPFIYHAINAWLNPSPNPFDLQIKPGIIDPKIASYLVEACVTSHYARWYPTYYIKAEGEVDVAYIKDNKFWPVEVKWTQQLRSNDLKQIQKYPNGIILSKQSAITQVNNTTCYPLAWYLTKLGFENSCNEAVTL